MNTRHILLLILSATILVACYPKIGELKPVDTTAYGSGLEIAGFTGLTIRVDGGKLVVDAPENQLCSKENRKLLGCLYIRRGYQADIGFRLNSKAIADGWGFTQFSICRGMKKPTRGQNCKPIRGERREWDASESRTSNKIIHLDENGIIDLTQLPDPAGPITKFVLHDQNSHRQDYFYNITACNGADCINFDPPVRNGGGK